MECSKCHVVKSIDGFYATGRVCKQCKIDYVRNYRRSKTVSNTQSKAAHTDENIYERLKKESYIQEHLQSKTNQDALERLQKCLSKVNENTLELLQKLELHVSNLSKVDENALERLQKLELHVGNLSKVNENVLERLQKLESHVHGLNRKIQDYSTIF